MLSSGQVTCRKALRLKLRLCDTMNLPHMTVRFPTIPIHEGSVNVCLQCLYIHKWQESQSSDSWEQRSFVYTRAFIGQNQTPSCTALDEFDLAPPSPVTSGPEKRSVRALRTPAVQTPAVSAVGRGLRRAETAKKLPFPIDWLGSDGSFPPERTKKNIKSPSSWREEQRDFPPSPWSKQVGCIHSLH